jgi:SAM-dependent methyltransferase
VTQIPPLSADEPRRERALEALRATLADPEVFTILEGILSTTYEKFLGLEGRDFAQIYFRSLRGLPDNPPLRLLARTILSMRDVFERLDLPERYRTFRRQNLKTSLRLVNLRLVIGDIADIGADDNALGDLLLEYPGVHSVVGLDVECRNPVVRPPKLAFVLQNTPSRIPLDDNTIDCVICRYSLHHMQLHIQNAILLEARRILRPHGSLVVFENSCSLHREPTDSDDLGFAKAITRLASWKRIALLMAALDVFSLGFKAKAMGFPETFRTVEDWENAAGRAGLVVRSSDYRGLPLLDLHQAPLLVMVLGKGH